MQSLTSGTKEQAQALAILCVANQENHQKRDDIGDRVNDEQPGVSKVKEWYGQRPDHYDADGEAEGHGMPARPHHRPGKLLKAAQQPGSHESFRIWC